jgi:hypothetical protein
LMDISETITVVLAIYGAGLSTILAIREWRRSRPSLRVTAEHGYVIDQGDYSEPVLAMKAANVGSGSIYVSGAGFTNRDGGSQVVAQPYPRGIIPVELKQGESVLTVYACRWVRESLDHEKIVGVFFQDQTGKRWARRLNKDEKAFCLASRGSGWALETRHPSNPVVKMTKRPPPR